MSKKSFAIYFGFVVLAMSLFASTAFASSALSVQVKDVDAAARKPFQTAGVHVDAPNGVNFEPLITVPANQRLVIEHISGYCDAVQGYVMLRAQSAGTETARQFLSNKDFMVTDTPASMPIRLYVNPGEDFGIATSNVGQSGYCNLALSGYFVNLP